jgi:peptide deformylase
VKLDIVKYPDPILRAACHLVTRFDEDETLHYAFLLNAALDKVGGRGLAAPQLGMPVQMAYIREPGFEPFYILNPVLVKGTGSVTTNEGCLSIPGFRGRVERPSKIWLEYKDLHGTQHTRRFRHDLAVVIQHEIDHLSGTLFIDKLIPADRLKWAISPANPLAQSVISYMDRNKTTGENACQ